MDGKKHELVFEHPNGMVLSIATDDLSELSQQVWFSAFFEDAVLKSTTQPVVPKRTPEETHRIRSDPYESANPFEQRQPQSIQRPVQQQPMLTFMDVPMDRMTVEYWSKLTPEQRAQWQAKWIPK